MSINEIKGLVRAMRYAYSMVMGLLGEMHIQLRDPEWQDSHCNFLGI
jgi:hypothetical protein